ncbi:PIN domain-containing protein [Streptomyces sp.]|uniref:PIN domain-containing protein n=1 Tax=Streptomyces sp. TaxID=1931 RepID=UPI002D77E9EA|nr:PIN domain-containing protein [Streptomyces sp.]HET6356110.1 PIN domain-containing protein [Streptomyces sp.]
MRIRNAGAIDDAIQTLTFLKHQCENARNPSALSQARDAYIGWVHTAERHFYSLFADEGMIDALHTASYWEIRRLTQVSPGAFALMQGEIERQVQRIDAAIEKLRQYREFASHPGKIVVPDTSALIRGVWLPDFVWQTHLDIKDSVRMVVPILVVEELDGFKDRDRTGTAGDRAAKVLKWLRELCRAVEPGAPAEVRNKVTIEVLLDDEWQRRRPNADAEIIDQALLVQEMTGTAVTLACVDASMEFRARQHGLNVYEMPTTEDVIKAKRGDT